MAGCLQVVRIYSFVKKINANGSRKSGYSEEQGRKVVNKRRSTKRKTIFIYLETVKRVKLNELRTLCLNILCIYFIFLVYCT